MAEILAIVLTLCAAPFVIGPLVVFYAFRVSAQPEHAPCELENPFVPDEFVTHVERTQCALYPEGFNYVGAAWSTAAWPRERFVALFENPATGVVALATLRVHGGRHPRALSAALRFVSENANGEHVVTDNDVAISGCPGTDPDRLAVTSIRSPQRLLRIHLARLEDAGGPGPKSGRIDGDPTVYANSEYVASLYAQLSRGSLQLDEETMELRPTWRGALATGVRYMGYAGWLRFAFHHAMAVVLLARAIQPLAPAIPESAALRARAA